MKILRPKTTQTTLETMVKVVQISFSKSEGDNSGKEHTI